jgi:hypothetical protein
MFVADADNLSHTASCFSFKHHKYSHGTNYFKKNTFFRNNFTQIPTSDPRTNLRAHTLHGYVGSGFSTTSESPFTSVIFDISSKIYNPGRQKLQKMIFLTDKNRANIFAPSQAHG